MRVQWFSSVARAAKPFPARSLPARLGMCKRAEAARVRVCGKPPTALGATRSSAISPIIDLVTSQVRLALPSSLACTLSSLSPAPTAPELPAAPTSHLTRPHPHPCSSTPAHATHLPAAPCRRWQDMSCATVHRRDIHHIHKRHNWRLLSHKADVRVVRRQRPSAPPPPSPASPPHSLPLPVRASPLSMWRSSYLTHHVASSCPVMVLLLLLHRSPLLPPCFERACERV